MKKPNRCDLLAEASALTSQERNKDYGDPVDNMTHIADIFNAITGHEIKPSDVAILTLQLNLLVSVQAHSRKTTTSILWRIWVSLTSVSYKR